MVVSFKKVPFGRTNTMYPSPSKDAAKLGAGNRACSKGALSEADTFKLAQLHL